MINRLKWWINRHRYPDQAWFWTPEWQAGEREADADIKAGNVKEFSTVKEFIEELERE